jgi:hypothetical protein
MKEQKHHYIPSFIFGSGPGLIGRSASLAIHIGRWLRRGNIPTPRAMHVAFTQCTTFPST